MKFKLRKVTKGDEVELKVSLVFTKKELEHIDLAKGEPVDFLKEVTRTKDAGWAFTWLRHMTHYVNLPITKRNTAIRQNLENRLSKKKRRRR